MVLVNKWLTRCNRHKSVGIAEEGKRKDSANNGSKRQEYQKVDACGVVGGGGGGRKGRRKTIKVKFGGRGRLL